MSREELITLSGQVANGTLSADSSVLSKVVDRALHKQVAEMSVNIAVDILRKIDNLSLVND